MRVRLALACGLVLMLAAPARAQRSLVIEDFTATIAIGTDGAIEVTETIRPRFTGSWNGLYRTIPVRYKTPQGLDYRLKLDVHDVSDGSGRALRYESSRERHYRKLKIWVPDAVDATRTVVLRYRVDNGLRFFEDHDELYWNVTGDEWEVPIEQAHAYISLPAAAEGVRVATFTGGYGSQEEAARWRQNGSTVAVDTTRALSFREGLTVAVAWNPGVVSRPSAIARGAETASDNWMLLIPVLVAGLMGRHWWKYGKDPARETIAVQYEPPETLTPAELGTLVDNRPDMRDVTATIVDLAVRGFLRIREEQTSRFFGLGTKTDYELLLLRPSSQWEGLFPHETKLLKGLFPSTNDQPVASDGAVSRVRVSDLHNTFYTHLQGIKTGIYDRLIARGYYRRRPDTVLVLWLVGAAGVLAAGLGLAAVVDRGGVPFVAAVLSAAVVAVFGVLMPARTVAGARARERVLGFQEFLDRVEADRLERMVRTPEMFERFLPFAMALGVERNWARAFDGIYTQAPSWYGGAHTGTFSPRLFAASLADLSSDTSSAMSSSPRSSGGSGFSGGSSGGGFGGGGGGGF